jgi:hypothetical protein
MIHRMSGGKITDEWSESSGILELAWEQGLQVARRIQQALLPKAVPTLEGWEISTHYQSQPERSEATSATSSSWMTEG